MTGYTVEQLIRELQKYPSYAWVMLHEKGSKYDVTCTTIEYTARSHPSLFLGISDQMMTLTIEHVDHVQIMDHADGITLKIRHHGGNEYQCSNFNINCSMYSAKKLMFWIVPR